MASEKYEIDLLIRQERHYRDMQQWEDLRNMWHPDNSKTRVSISFITGTAEDWITSSKRVIPTKATTGIQGPFHPMEPKEILIRDNRALATTLISIHMRFPYKGVVLDVESWAHQQQRFVRIANAEGGSEWKLTSFEAIYIRDSLMLPYPQPGSEEAMKEAGEEIEKMDARPSMRIMAWQFKQLGVKLSETLPGYDDEKTWKPLTERNRKWLESGEV